MDNHVGTCVYGICMTYASSTCSAAGFAEECSAGSRCWGVQGQDGYSFCWPDCSSNPCDGECDTDGSSAPTTDTNCDLSCAVHCASDDPGPTGDGPGQGPGPDCPSLPPRDCTGSASYCAELVQYNPSTTTGYDDYPINGETSGNQYRSWVRRDLMMLLSFAGAKVACKTAGWNTGNGGPVGLGDMSEEDGSIPGTSIGSPGHPAGTHTNGFDTDFGYYQQGTANNRLRPICEHYSAGVDPYHCTAPPNALDVWRSAYMLGILFESPRTRVIGVDGQAGPLLTDALNELCTTGWLSSAACSNNLMAFDTTDMNRGWYRFHHHHMHISLRNTAFAPMEEGLMPCKATGPGEQTRRKPNPRRFRSGSL